MHRHPIRCRRSPVGLIAIGAVLLVFAFLAAFTIYGELSAVAGVACIVIGAICSARRSSSRSAGRSVEQ